MKKGSILILCVLVVVAIAVWFSCNPFQQEDSKSNLNVLDDSARLSISCTIVVNGGTWDGGGQTIYASGMGDGSQSESQDPIFQLYSATVRNVTIGAPACDGLHYMSGSCSISNVDIPDVGEDACTVKGQGTYNLGGGCVMNNSEDKLFQINDLCTTTYSASGTNMGKAVRQNGGKTWKCTIYIEGSYQGINEALVRSDSTSTTVRYRNISCNLASSSWWYGNFVVQGW